MMGKLSILLPVVLAILCSTSAFAQKDSTEAIVKTINADTISYDTLNTKNGFFSPSRWSKPEKAAIMSAVLPGLGQIYNKKYWKVPIVYVLGGFLLSSTLYHHSEYKVVRDGLQNNEWTDTTNISVQMQGGNLLVRQPYTIYNESQYTTARDNERITRDRYIVVTTIFYILNIVDAAVDAHLSEFDLTDDLSLQINPSFYAINNKFAPQLSLNFVIKK